MKNRTVIGIICMILAVVITFVIAPVVNNLTSDTIHVHFIMDEFANGATRS